MFRHVVMMRWNPETTRADVNAISEGLGGLPAAIPELRDYRFGADAGLNEGNFDFVVVADFESADDYVVYRDHPTHRAIVTELIVPHLADRAAVQYPLSD